MRNLLIKFILGTLSIVILLCFIELSLRIYSKFDNKLKFFLYRDKVTYEETKERGIPEICFYTEHWKNVYQPSFLLGYEHVPNRGNINSFGLVGKEYKLKKERGIFRILLLGDSIAEQNGTRNFLEEKLNDNTISHSNYHFEIWNSGTAGWDIRKYALFLKDKGLRYKPDMALLFFCLNDLKLYNMVVYYKTKEGTIGYDFPIEELSKIYTPNASLLKYSYLYRLITFRLNSYLINKKNRYSEVAIYFKMIKDICDERDIYLLAVIFPKLNPLNEYTPDELENYETILKELRDLNFNFIDLHDFLPKERRHLLRYSQEDDIHLSQDGERIVANIIYDYLIQNRILSYSLPYESKF